MPSRRSRERSRAARRARSACPARARAAATASRSAGATSCPKRWIARGSSVARMKVLKPCSVTSGSSASTSRGSWMLSSRRISRGSRPAAERRLVDRAVGGARCPAAAGSQRRQPAVGLAAGEPQHPRLVGAEPDLDVVRRLGTALGALDGVVLAAHAHAAARVGVPDAADDVDRLAAARRPPRRACGAGRPSPRSRPRTRRRRGRARRARRTAGRGWPPSGRARRAGAAAG